MVVVAAVVAVGSESAAVVVMVVVAVVAAVVAADGDKDSNLAKARASHNSVAEPRAAGVSWDRYAGRHTAAAWQLSW